MDDLARKNLDDLTEGDGCEVVTEGFILRGRFEKYFRRRNPNPSPWMFYMTDESERRWAIPVAKIVTIRRAKTSSTRRA